jgi:secretion/DNA translocation related CpaE-like protein
VVVARGDDGPAWPAALALGAEQVLVLPGDERSMLAWFARAAAGQRERARTIGVLGGSGGAGASVLAVAVALALARRSADVVLVDTDPGSCGIDLLLGAEDEPGARWCDLAAVTSRVAPEALRSALPLVHGLHLLSVDRDSDAPLPEAAVAAVVDSARAGFAAVVLDLPRSRPDLLDVLVPRCDEVLLVATSDVRGASAARRALTALGARVPVRLVLRRRRRSSLDPDQLADWLGAPVAAEVLDDDGLTAAIDRGEPPGPRSRLSRVCDDLAESLLAVS